MQRHRIIKIVKQAGLAATLTIMVSTIVVGFRESRIDLAATSSAPFMACMGCYAAFCVLNANGWLLILKVLGNPVPIRQGIPLWIRSESFRWLPGSVWNFGVRSVEACSHGVSRGVGAASMTLELGFTVVGRLVFVALAGLLFADQIRLVLGNVIVVTAVCGLAALLVMALVFLFGKQYATRFRTALQSPWKIVTSAKRWRANLGLLFYYLGLGLLHGVALQYLLTALVADHQISALAIIGANSAAWIVGFFAVFAPGGLVVREAALAAALSAWLTPADGLSVAIAWRFLQIVVEFGLLTGVLCWTHRRSPVPQMT